MSVNAVAPPPPFRTAMLGADGHVSVQWAMYFQWLAAGGSGGPMQRTLLLKNTAVRNDAADHVPVYAPGVGIRILAVLRKAITADLQVRINKGTYSAVITIPRATAINTVLATSISGVPFGDSEVLTADILASDGNADADGIASVTIEWSSSGVIPAGGSGGGSGTTLIPVGPVAPTGAIDGANAIFTLPDAPSKFLVVYRNNEYQVQGTDFVLVTNTITFTTPPLIGDTLTAYYWK